MIQHVLVRVARLAAIGLATVTAALPVAAANQELTNEVIAAAIREGIGNRPADAMGTRCSRYFQVGSVEVVDRRIAGTSAQVEAIVTVHPFVNVDTMTILMCFRVVTNRGWRAGGNDVLKGTYDFELWESGWRYVEKRR